MTLACFLTTPLFIKSLHMDLHVSRLVGSVTPSSFVLPQRMLSFPLLECCADSTYLLCIIMKMRTDHRPKRRKVYLSSKSHFQRLGRESAELNLKRHSRPLVMLLT